MPTQELPFGILESVPDAMVVVDAQGRIAYLNGQALALFGYESAEVVGQPVERLLPERLQARHAAHRREYSRSSPVRPMGCGPVLRAARKDGVEIPVEIRLGPAGDGRQTYVAATIRDITARLSQEAQVREARDHAERASHGKSFFMAAASHDLRQPLQSIALLNGALRRMTRDAQLREILEEQDKAVATMAALLNSLLEISRLESGESQPRLVDFDVAALLEEVRRAFEQAAAQKGLALRVTSDSHCARSDRSLVGLVTRNLLENAIRRTESGWVELRATGDRGRISIAVSDSGPGLPAEHEALLLSGDLPPRDSRGAPRDGISLGLMIARHAIELLDAGIRVRSATGGGSTVSLELPRSLSAGNSPGTPAADAPLAPSAGKSRSVLLVEDDPAVRRATQRYLEQEGFRVLTASNYDEAMQQVHNGSAIEMVISDYHLDTGRTGAEVIAEARSRLGPGLRAIIVTGEDSKLIANDLSDHRVRVSSKPVRAEELLQLIRSLMNP